VHVDGVVRYVRSYIHIYLSLSICVSVYLSIYLSIHFRVNCGRRFYLHCARIYVACGRSGALCSIGLILTTNYEPSPRLYVLLSSRPPSISFSWPRASSSYVCLVLSSAPLCTSTERHCSSLRFCVCSVVCCRVSCGLVLVVCLCVTCFSCYY